MSGSGTLQVLASSGQEALDLSLVARRVAEHALVPGLVCTDLEAVESLNLPDEEAIRSYLGEPEQPVTGLGEAQRLLFGLERPRVMAWFDPDRPVATGGVRSAEEAARARFANRLFFWESVAEIAAQAMEELTRLTGRPLSFLQEHRLEDAEMVLVVTDVSEQREAQQRARRLATLVDRARFEAILVHDEAREIIYCNRAAEEMFGYSANGPNTAKAIESLADLEPSALALMHGPTYMGNPLACAAANASLDLFEREPRLEQVAAIESAFRDFLDQLGPAAEQLEARCLGAILALTLDRRLNDAATRDFFVRRGVWLRPIDNVLYVCPPLTISSGSLQTILGAVAEFTVDATRQPDALVSRSR